MTSNDLRQIAELLYGNLWITPMAEAVGLTRRQMQRIASGVSGVSDDVSKKALLLLYARRESIDLLIRHHERRPENQTKKDRHPTTGTGNTPEG